MKNNICILIILLLFSYLNTLAQTKKTSVFVNYGYASVSESRTDSYYKKTDVSPILEIDFQYKLNKDTSYYVSLFTGFIANKISAEEDSLNFSQIIRYKENNIYLPLGISFGENKRTYSYGFKLFAATVFSNQKFYLPNMSLLPNEYTYVNKSKDYVKLVLGADIHLYYNLSKKTSIGAFISSIFDVTDIKIDSRVHPHYYTSVGFGLSYQYLF